MISSRMKTSICVLLFAIAVFALLFFVETPSGWNTEIFHLVGGFASLLIFGLPGIMNVRNALYIELWGASLSLALGFVLQLPVPKGENPLIFKVAIVFSVCVVFVYMFVRLLIPRIARDTEIV